jgi:hypothetical protein
MSYLFGTEFLLFPFWCLDVKGGEESFYLVISIYVVHRFYLDLACKTLFSMCWSCGHDFKNICGVLVRILLCSCVGTPQSFTKIYG